MFRPTDRQSSLLQSKFLMPAKKAARLEKSWAHAFRTVVMPLIDEETFRDAFHDSNGRPNKSILLLMGAHILKHWNDLTDAQVIEQVEFNLQWQYALNITPEEAHLVQRTMHSFRQLLLENDRARQMFDDITRKLAAADGVALGHQRVDSTHVISNIAVLTRLTLFVETVTKFLRALRSEFPERLDDVAAAVRRRYLEREGYFNDAKREQAKRRLPVVAQDIHGLLELFSGDGEVSEMPSFSLLCRLFSEQCELVDEIHAGTDDDVGDEAAATSSDEQKIPVTSSKPEKTVSNSSLQSLHHTDATDAGADDAGADDGVDTEPSSILVQALIFREFCGPNPSISIEGREARCVLCLLGGPSQETRTSQLASIQLWGARTFVRPARPLFRPISTCE